MQSLREVLQEEVGEVLVGQHDAGLYVGVDGLLTDGLERGEEVLALLQRCRVAGRRHHRGVRRAVRERDLCHRDLPSDSTESSTARNTGDAVRSAQWAALRPSSAAALSQPIVRVWAAVRPAAARLAEGIGVTQLERVVGAQQHVLGADVLDEPAQQRRREHRGVVVQPVGVRARAAAAVVRATSLSVPAHVHPPAQRRQAAAAVGQAQGQVEALQHAAEDQAGHRERGLHRVADELRQVEVALPRGVRYAAGVQEDERTRARPAAPTARR